MEENELRVRRLHWFTYMGEDMYSDLQVETISDIVSFEELKNYCVIFKRHSIIGPAML